MEPSNLLMWVEILVLGVEVLVIFLLFIHFRKIDSHTSVLKDHFEKLSETVEEIDRHLREHEEEMDDRLNEHETGMDQWSLGIILRESKRT